MAKGKIRRQDETDVQWRTPQDRVWFDLCPGVRACFWQSKDGQKYSGICRCDEEHPHQYDLRRSGYGGPWQQIDRYRDLPGDMASRHAVEHRGGTWLGCCSYERGADEWRRIQEAGASASGSEAAQSK